MKNDREFTGTLMGFDDYVSESILSPVDIPIKSDGPFEYSIGMQMGRADMCRYGSTGCQRIVYLHSRHHHLNALTKSFGSLIPQNRC